METFSKKDCSILKNLFYMSEEQLYPTLDALLHSYDYATVVTNEYIYAVGTMPFLLVAHIDTVFPSLPRNIFYDKEQQVMWSPDGLGADDRVGVFLIIKLLIEGYRPHILFTRAEEKGGLGAQAFAKSNLLIDKNINYIMQLDRHGRDDCVFYDCDNPDFNKYINSFGFKTQSGTYTDISFICPVYGIAGVNLSVGYVDEHSYAEHVYLNDIFTTFEKVKKMLNDKDCIPYKYIPKKYSVFNHANSEKSENRCHNCGSANAYDDLLPVQIANGDKVPYCIECISTNVNWCDKCGEPFENYGNKEIKICYNCSIGDGK